MPGCFSISSVKLLYVSTINTLNQVYIHMWFQRQSKIVKIRVFGVGSPLIGHDNLDYGWRRCTCENSSSKVGF